MSELSFAEKLLIARRQLDLYQYQMAERLGVHANSLTKYEKGEGKPHAAVVRVFEMLCEQHGIRVDEFAIGFGPKIWGRLGAEKNGVRILYSLRAIPFGGFVKIYGEDGEENTLADSFASKNRGKQIVVLLAGILFNFIFAWLILSAIFMVGEPVSPDSYPQYASRIQNVHVIVDDVLAGSPAAKAGLKADDTIKSIGSAGATSTIGIVIQNPTAAQICGASTIAN